MIKMKMRFYWRLLRLLPILILEIVIGWLIWRWSRSFIISGLISALLVTVVIGVLGMRWGFSRPLLIWYVSLLCGKDKAQCEKLRTAKSVLHPLDPTDNITYFIVQFETAWQFARD